MFFRLSLLILVILTRFLGLRWGDGYFFHPDENNMATAVSQIIPSNLNPHFFAYGQFPLYLAYFSLKTFSLPPTFAHSVYALRFWSAVFSGLSILIFYLIYPSFLFVLLLIFSPGLIQLAHFGTTESLLVLVLAFNLYLARLILCQPKFAYFFWAALVTGIGLAAKISSIVFFLPILLAALLGQFKNRLSLLLFAGGSLLLTIIFFLIFSPYNFLARSDFFSTLNYEIQVATGQLKVFYTSQFLHTIPYFFQLTNIFPYTSGFPVFVIGILGYFLILKSYLIRPKSIASCTVLLFSGLIYFAYFGQLYAKWTRFVSPLFFSFPLFASYLLVRIKNTIIVNLLLSISILPGILLLTNYLRPDIRLTASDWINQNIPAHSRILSEAGNVINLPVANYAFRVTNYDFYHLDQDPSLVARLPQELLLADYILIPSRRIFKNQSNSDFPVSQKYYQALFSGRLGFKLVKYFSPLPDLFFNAENAEETWTVFDRPTIRIFQKTRPLTLSQYAQILKV